MREEGGRERGREITVDMGIPQLEHFLQCAWRERL
jgi:hypothetical protein